MMFLLKMLTCQIILKNSILQFLSTRYVIVALIYGEGVEYNFVDVRKKKSNKQSHYLVEKIFMICLISWYNN